PPAIGNPQRGQALRRPIGRRRRADPLRRRPGPPAARGVSRAPPAARPPSGPGARRGPPASGPARGRPGRPPPRPARPRAGPPDPPRSPASAGPPPDPGRRPDRLPAPGGGAVAGDQLPGLLLLLPRDPPAPGPRVRRAAEEVLRHRPQPERRR